MTGFPKHCSYRNLLMMIMMMMRMMRMMRMRMRIKILFIDSTAILYQRKFNYPTY